MKYFNLIVAILLSIIYITGHIPPSQGFNLWITSFVIPVALIINHVLLIIFLILRKRSALYYFAALLIGIPYLTSTIGIKYLLSGHNGDAERLSILNYNMGFYLMRTPHHYDNRDSARLALKNWILNSDADVTCIQEFANITGPNQFNLTNQLKSHKLFYAFSTDDPGARDGRWQAGTIIISKFPILSSGDVLARENGFNRIAYADIKVNSDTVRIVNVHLESMGLTIRNPKELADPHVAKSQAYTILRKLKVGVFERSKQIRQLADFIERSPYRVICVGDFNDLPYSYNYRYMKKSLKNAFEESGKGFGFTYNGGTLKLLRIDNQFYSSGLRSVEFETLYDVELSDHFPIRGEYMIEKTK